MHISRLDENTFVITHYMLNGSDVCDRYELNERSIGRNES